jgi:sugar-specific transcriptional regulator TrmB
MIGLHEISLSAQAREVYKLLLADGEMTAVKIGERLEIYPNAVYRLLEKLESLGCAIKLVTYPATYKAVAPKESVERFLLLARESFLSTFSKKDLARKEELRVNFIKDRDSMLSKYAKEMKTAKTGVDMIISGHELPADVYFANLKAAKRGVKIRIIVQHFGRSNREIIKSWQDCGIEVRYQKSIDIRLILIDKCILHIMSYQRKMDLSDLGVELAYAPLAEMFSGIFEEKWHAAKKISKIT